jgi:hypothetical protein
MEEIIGDSGFDTIGEFLRILFYNPIRGKDDPRGTAHGLAVARFLQGKTNVKMSEIIDLIYSHKHSAPSSRSTHYHERHAPFSPSVTPSDIQHARPCLFTWATKLVGKHVYQEIFKLTLKTEDSPLTVVDKVSMVADDQQQRNLDETDLDERDPRKGWHSRY